MYTLFTGRLFCCNCSFWMCSGVMEEVIFLLGASTISLDWRASIINFFMGKKRVSGTLLCANQVYNIKKLDGSK
jgi:hypothetical protein